VVLAFFVGNDLLEQQGVPPVGCGTLSAGMARWSLAYRAARNLYRLHSGPERAPDRSDFSDRIDMEGRDRTEGGQILDCAHAGLDDPSYARHFDPGRPAFSVERFTEIQQHRLSILLRSRRRCLDHMLARAERSLEELHQEVRSAGARLVVMLIPDQLQVEELSRAELLEQAGIEPSEVDLDVPQQELRRILDQNGIEVVDLLPELRARQGDGPLYLPRNTHWNAAGNRVAARVLARELLLRGLVVGQLARQGDSAWRDGAEGAEDAHGAS